MWGLSNSSLTASNWSNAEDRCALPTFVFKIYLVSRLLVPLGPVVISSLSPSCLRGQPEGLITDLPGLHSDISTISTAHRIDEGWPVSISGSTHASRKLIKTQLMGVIYCMALVCVLCVLFTCACVSRTLAPAGSWPHNPHPPSRGRGGRAKMAVISFCGMCHLFSLGE